MGTHDVSKQYAKSLWGIAASSGIQKKMYEDVLLIDSTCAGCPNLRTTLAHPLRSITIKIKILHEIFGSIVQPETMRFLELIIYKKRAAILQDITQEWFLYYRQYFRIQLAYITTTFQLSDELRTVFKAQAMEWVKGIRSVELKEYIDPNILGGYILQIGDKRLDASLKTKIISLINA